MALKYVKDSLPWLVPSAAIAFAAFVFMDGGIRQNPVPPVEPTAAAPEPLDTEDEVVARQATPEASLNSVAVTPALTQPVAAPAPVPEPAPEPQPVRQAALAVAPTAAPVFDTSGFNANSNAQCIEDLRAMASEARVYFPSGGLTADSAGIEQGRLLGLIAQNCPGVQIRVDGHSDPSGDPSANLVLSERRAQEVIKRIGAGGIDTSNFFARGMGDRQPSGLNGPRPAAFYDRRVEFTVVEEVTRVAVRTNVTASPWANASCVTDLQRAADSTVLFYAPRSVSLRPDDLNTAMALAELAVACPHARLRVIGQHAGGVQTGEDVATGRLRAKALMAMLVGRGIASEQIIIAAPSRPVGLGDQAGLPGSRVDFDVILEDG
ncbi:OmpA family protein [uncultured Tateyamaria sp.]|uniref:OmpA family protein n=1 Tax=Tateyamaria sp. 1078 TaxID=3417464 RepID=UPI0026331E27|nr:OmpA family protein [uncultured Tateyamaria sp.]